MAGWTGKESALAIRASVQRFQSALGDLPRTGKYDRATHLRAYAVLSGVGRGVDFDSSGPAVQDLLDEFPGFEEMEAKFLRLAWAWWAQKRERPIPSGAQAVILEMNVMLSGDGNMALTPKDADEFVGDAPVITVLRASLTGLGILVVLGVFALGERWGRARCARDGGPRLVDSPAPALRGSRRRYSHG